MLRASSRCRRASRVRVAVRGGREAPQQHHAHHGRRAALSDPIAAQSAAGLDLNPFARCMGTSTAAACWAIFNWICMWAAVRRMDARQAMMMVP